jgi:hypothetical protein
VQESVKYLKADNLEVEALQITTCRRLRKFRLYIQGCLLLICASFFWNTVKIYIAVVTLILHSENVRGIEEHPVFPKCQYTQNISEEISSLHEFLHMVRFILMRSS